MMTKWHKNHEHCQECGTTKEKYLAKGKCKRCYERINMAKWVKRKTQGIFIMCTRCGKKWQAKQLISKWYNPQLCLSCSGIIKAAQKKKKNQIAIEKKFKMPLKELFNDHYYKRKMTGLEIVKYLGISPDQTYRWGNEMGIKFRNPLFKKGNQLFKGLTPHNKGRTLEELYGKEKADEIKNHNRLYMSIESKKRWRQGLYKNSRMGAGAAGKRKDVGFKRSTWEANIARIFQYKKQKFKYEPKIFQLTKKNGAVTTFTPDFKVNNSWWEIKGWMDKRSLEKIKLFLQQYPNKKLVIVCKSKQKPKLSKKYKYKYINYFQLEKNYKLSIPNWETSRNNFKTHPEKFK